MALRYTKQQEPEHDPNHGAVQKEVKAAVIPTDKIGQSSRASSKGREDFCGKAIGVIIIRRRCRS